jgi:hypothetical protein
MVEPILDSAAAHGEEPNVAPVVESVEVEEPPPTWGAYEVEDWYLDEEFALSGIHIWQKI